MSRRRSVRASLYAKTASSRMFSHGSILSKGMFVFLEGSSLPRCPIPVRTDASFVRHDGSFAYNQRAHTSGRFKQHPRTVRVVTVTCIEVACPRFTSRVDATECMCYCSSRWRTVVVAHQASFFHVRKPSRFCLPAAIVPRPHPAASLLRAIEV